MSQMYEWGDGGSRDKEKALYWCRKAVELGNVNAQAKLGYDLAQQEKYEEAVYWYEKAAKQGHKDLWQILDIAICMAMV